ncbi:MAG: nitrogen regulation protein NR(I) [Gammaproteobacteria bacterium]|nr:nitrogen regulation protein NR(I) [Gammaproteobacteria bacterium]MBU1508306.1 nitrogen regulation protein NR(I) [Gammaproteobacteria bacterium]MBU2122129.1 nitrogen regulation protein NR(I) [Gammaproteobacteria bacterium]MBU2169770.1 nitrogen regulation protein NR(I) [Gammaproteobacteria bacterium]MBU2199614.1 nitrogen regulation protein NR(I) [Gammaproteobacteria bacterium]
MKPIWLVDDDPSIRFVLEKALARENLPTRSFTHPREVLDALADITAGDPARQGPQVLVSDIRMPGGSGLQLLEKVRELQPGLPVIIMTAYSDLDSAVSAFQRGAFEYLPKPFDLPKAVELIRRAVEESQREEVTEERQAETPEMLGQAPAMQDVFRAIGRLSQSQVTVLITGESGSGKELVARALHKHSPCADGPFVAINTAAIPKDLLESELFGHERGAFTGAQTQRRGRFEQAEGGTLFLDEIGDMPFDLQTRLLRVLSDGQFYRVGGHAAVKAHVRVIAATHQDLEKRVKEGGFREDLFHRLNVIRLRLPALRERHEDVPMLTRHFLLQSARQLGVEPKRIADSALARLEQFAFPGNVRQLENICHWLTVMAPAQVISLQDLPPEVLEAPMYQLPVRAEQSAAAVSAATQTAPIVSVPAPELVGGIHPAASAPTTASVGASAETTMTGAAALAGAPSWSVPDAHATPGMVAVSTAHTWEQALEVEAQKLLAGGQPEVWDALTRRFESRLIRTALLATHGRRMEAAQRLGIGRNTITRKIQELGLDAPDEA